MNKRKQLVDSFHRTSALLGAKVWNSAAHDLFTNFQVGRSALEHPSAIQRALVFNVQKMKRYFLALQRLSYEPVEDGALLHAIDGIHAIHKSLFETYVEFALSLVYIELFDSEKDDAGHDLGQRMLQYSDFAARKKNFGYLHRMDSFNELMMKHANHVQLSEGLRAFINLGKDGVRNDLSFQTKLIQGEGNHFKNVQHWFPEKTNAGDYFVEIDQESKVRPRNCGSMQWRCKAVLANHFPDVEMRLWWLHSYDSHYDLLNTYSHPALGYDECFRPVAERLLDLARMQIGIRLVFHKCVLPPLRLFFQNQWSALLNEDNKLEELNLEVTKIVLPYSLAVDQTDYEVFSAGRA